MKKRIIATVMALCLVAGTSTFAQGSTTSPATKERPTVEQMAQRRTDRMTEKLGLDAKQAKQIHALNLERAKQMQAKFEQMNKAREAEAAQMKSILTPEQYTQWTEMRDSRQGAMRGKGNMHGKSGMQGRGGMRGQGNKQCCMKESNKPCPKRDKK